MSFPITNSNNSFNPISNPSFSSTVLPVSTLTGKSEPYLKDFFDALCSQNKVVKTKEEALIRLQENPELKILFWASNSNPGIIAFAQTSSDQPPIKFSMIHKQEKLTEIISYCTKELKLALPILKEGVQLNFPEIKEEIKKEIKEEKIELKTGHFIERNYLISHIVETLSKPTLINITDENFKNRLIECLQSISSPVLKRFFIFSLLKEKVVENKEEAEKILQNDLQNNSSKKFLIWPSSSVQGKMGFMTYSNFEPLGIREPKDLVVVLNHIKILDPEIENLFNFVNLSLSIT